MLSQAIVVIEIVKDICTLVHPLHLVVYCSLHQLTTSLNERSILSNVLFCIGLNIISRLTMFLRFVMMCKY